MGRKLLPSTLETLFAFGSADLEKFQFALPISRFVKAFAGTGGLLPRFLAASTPISENSFPGSGPRGRERRAKWRQACRSRHPAGFETLSENFESRCCTARRRRFPPARNFRQRSGSSPAARSLPKSFGIRASKFAVRLPKFSSAACGRLRIVHSAAVEFFGNERLGSPFGLPRLSKATFKIWAGGKLFPKRKALRFSPFQCGGAGFLLELTLRFCGSRDAFGLDFANSETPRFAFPISRFAKTAAGIGGRLLQLLQLMLPKIRFPIRATRVGTEGEGRERPGKSKISAEGFSRNGF